MLLLCVIECFSEVSHFGTQGNRRGLYRFVKVTCRLLVCFSLLFWSSCVSIPQFSTVSNQISVNFYALTWMALWLEPIWLRCANILLRWVFFFFLLYCFLFIMNIYSSAEKYIKNYRKCSFFSWIMRMDTTFIKLTYFFPHISRKNAFKPEIFCKVSRFYLL